MNDQPLPEFKASLASTVRGDWQAEVLFEAATIAEALKWAQDKAALWGGEVLTVALEE